MLNLATLLENSARSRPGNDAFIFMDRHLSYLQVNAGANRVANALKSIGVQPGDKVALSCLNLPDFPILYFGILKAGAIVVPLSVLLKRAEIQYHLQDAEVKAYFCFVGTPDLPMAEEGLAAFHATDSCEHFFVITPQLSDPSPFEGIPTVGKLIEPHPETSATVATQAEDTAVIIYTSGTTGRPKGAELTHANLLLNAILSADIIGTTKVDRQLIVLPLFHIFAMTCLMNAGVYKGCASVLLPRFDARTVIGLMQKHQVSVFAGVPTMYWGLLNTTTSEEELSLIQQHLKSCISGGASLPVQVLQDFEAKFKVPILEGYGMSEGSPVVTFNQRDVGRKPGSIGTPVWGVEVKIVDENDQEVVLGEKGELVYRGHNVMKGYYHRPEVNAEVLRDGWMHSGDIAVQDEDGFFYIVDRTKDMIIRGGLNVYPREVEEVMIRHEAVSFVAIIGVPDEKLGEEIKAYVVLHPEQELKEEELIDWTRKQVAAYKYPREVVFVEALPMNATGKILKKELRKMSSEQV